MQCQRIAGQKHLNSLLNKVYSICEITAKYLMINIQVQVIFELVNSEQFAKIKMKNTKVKWSIVAATIRIYNYCEPSVLCEQWSPYNFS